MYSIVQMPPSSVSFTKPDTRASIWGANCVTWDFRGGDRGGGNGVGTPEAATEPHGLPATPSSHVATRGLLPEPPRRPIEPRRRSRRKSSGRTMRATAICTTASGGTNGAGGGGGGFRNQPINAHN